MTAVHAVYAASLTHAVATLPHVMDHFYQVSAPRASPVGND